MKEKIVVDNQWKIKKEQKRNFRPENIFENLEKLLHRFSSIINMTEKESVNGFGKKKSKDGRANVLKK